MTGKFFKYKNFKNFFKQTFKKKENKIEEEKINQSAQSRPEGPLPRSGAPEGALDFYPEYLPNPSTIKFSLKQNRNKYKMKIVFVALPSGYRLSFKAQRTKGSPRNNWMDTGYVKYPKLPQYVGMTLDWPNWRWRW